jgi:hypothetical protein
MAVGLAQRQNIHRVAGTLRLDYGAWKRRMPGSHPQPTTTFVGKRQSNGIYAQAFFGAEVEAWWHREGSIAGTGAGRKRIG